MILNEQKYANKNRLYYHGTDTGKITKEKWACVFLTTDIEYALDYTTKFQVIACTIKAPLNIFSARHKTDLFRLQKVLTLNEKDIDTLQNADWMYNDMSYDRNELFKVTEELGYDGIFNYECDRNAGSINPSLGLFDVNNVIQRKTYQYENLIIITKVKDKIRAKQQNIENHIIEMAIDDSERNVTRSKEAFFQEIFKLGNLYYIEKKYANSDELYDMYLKYNDKEMALRERLFQVIYRDAKCIQWTGKGDSYTKFRLNSIREQYNHNDKIDTFIKEIEEKLYGRQIRL